MGKALTCAEGVKRLEQSSVLPLEREIFINPKTLYGLWAFEIREEKLIIIFYFMPGTVLSFMMWFFSFIFC